MRLAPLAPREGWPVTRRVQSEAIDLIEASSDSLQTDPRRLLRDRTRLRQAEQLLRRTATLVASGVTMVCLLALNDDGAPCYDERLAGQMTALGAPSFACTPDKFADLMAVALSRGDLDAWAARNDIVTRKA